jgi:hypothetical protein
MRSHYWLVELAALAASAELTPVATITATRR